MVQHSKPYYNYSEEIEENSHHDSFQSRGEGEVIKVRVRCPIRAFAPEMCEYNKETIQTDSDSLPLIFHEVSLICTDIPNLTSRPLKLLDSISHHSSNFQNSLLPHNMMTSFYNGNAATNVRNTLRRPGNSKLAPEIEAPQKRDKLLKKKHINIKTHSGLLPPDLELNRTDHIPNLSNPNSQA